MATNLIQNAVNDMHARDMQELIAFERMFHAAITGISSEYHTPKFHEVGQALKQAYAVCYNVYDLLEKLTGQYERECEQRDHELAAAEQSEE